MERVIGGSAVEDLPPARVTEIGRWRECLRDRHADALALTLAVGAVPISIAVAESFLAVAIIARVIRSARGQTKLFLPRVFWYWLAWAGLELVSMALSPNPAAGWSELRRLFLIAGLFFLMPALGRASDRLTAWKGIFLASALSSIFLIGDFLARLVYYQREIAAGGDVSLYLRSGGLLSHWMVFGTVEILVFAGLLSFWLLYREERHHWWPVLALNTLAAILSLTRMVWICFFLLLGLALAWRRSKWLWALPLLPLALYFLAPAPIRSRVNESMRPGYYSNAERVQMLRVGLKMIAEKPLIGVGPGRVGGLYLGYLSPDDPVPAYHGHLHNNLIQLAAQFGLPAVAAALLFIISVFRELVRALKNAPDREARFICQTALLALTGFLIAGLFDYTYGHSLSLILLGFAVIPAISPCHESLSEIPPNS
jgi:O-antigen ligase